MNFLSVLFTVTAKPGSEATLRDIMQSLVTLTRAEPGCISYELHVDAKNPATFTTYECWTDQAALDAHFKTPYVQAAIGRASGIIDGSLDTAMTVLTPVRPTS
jgi:quinol monooxygenase YgiN